MGRVKTEAMCAWARCTSTQLAWEVRWSTNCRKHKWETFCEKHARRISDDRGATYVCDCKPSYNQYFTSIEKVTRTGSAEPYQDARQAWLDHGGLENKDRMVDAVTLTVPASWDVYGSIMADPPKVSVLGRNIAFGLTIGMLIAAMGAAFFGGILMALVLIA
jgi:hypothetical protein